MMAVCLQAKSGLTKRAVDWRDLRHFWAFSTPEQNPALGVLSTPARQPLTQTVGQPLLWQR